MMGRPPASGAPVFRFFPKEVQEMEKILEDGKAAIPPRDTISSLAEKFSAAPERAGKTLVQWKQVWTWFQNRKYAQKAKGTKVPGKTATSARDDSRAKRVVTNSVAVPSGRTDQDASEMEFEAKSSRDGAWYDVASFVTHRMFESGDPRSCRCQLVLFVCLEDLSEAEVRIRFAGFGAEEDEWVNVKKCVRERSLPCEASECVAVLSGDLILCFQEGKEHALYFDAHVLDAQRRRHDARGCRCRFLVRYDHDQSEEIVPLWKVCRRPETDYRLQLIHASKEISTIELDQGSQQVKGATAAPVCHFGEATAEEFHLSPEISKITSQVIEENVQSLTAPKTSSVLQPPEGLSADSQRNLLVTEIDSSQKTVAAAFTAMDKPSNSMVDVMEKSTVQD